MKGIPDELAGTSRGVRRQRTDGTEEVAVVLRRRYDAPVEDVWDALTDPDRLRRWFLPVTGDLRPGGTHQLEANVGGEVVRCEEPQRLTVTWGGPFSVVDVRLSAGGDGAVLELEHTVPVEVAGSGAGALFVGPGWDVTVLALGRFLGGVVVEDPTAWENTPEVQRYNVRTIAAWADVVAASGTATEDEVAAGVEMARAQFTPDLAASGDHGAGD
ncbi:SRPBCC family protein [Geodermatophilus sp. SYSU D01105]